jgi:hypothetical protein
VRTLRLREQNKAVVTASNYRAKLHERSECGYSTRFYSKYFGRATSYPPTMGM